MNPDSLFLTNAASRDQEGITERDDREHQEWIARQIQEVRDDVRSGTAILIPFDEAIARVKRKIEAVRSSSLT